MNEGQNNKPANFQEIVYNSPSENEIHIIEELNENQDTNPSQNQKEEESEDEEEKEEKVQEIKPFEFDCKNLCILFEQVIDHLTEEKGETGENALTEKRVKENINLEELNTFMTNVQFLLRSNEECLTKFYRIYNNKCKPKLNTELEFGKLFIAPNLKLNFRLFMTIIVINLEILKNFMEAMINISGYINQKFVVVFHIRLMYPKKYTTLFDQLINVIKQYTVQEITQLKSYIEDGDFHPIFKKQMKTWKTEVITDLPEIINNDNININAGVFQIIKENYNTENIVKILEILIDLVLSTKMFPSPNVKVLNNFFSILSDQFDAYFIPIFKNYQIDNLNGAFLLMENRGVIVSRKDSFLYDLLNFLLNFQTLDQKEWFFDKNMQLPNCFLGKMICHLYFKWMFIYLVIEKNIWMQELTEVYEDFKTNYPVYFFNLYELKELQGYSDKMIVYETTFKWERKNEYLFYYIHIYLMKTKILITGTDITRKNNQSFTTYNAKFDNDETILNLKDEKDRSLTLNIQISVNCVTLKPLIGRIQRWLKAKFQIQNVLVQIKPKKRKSDLVCEISYPLMIANFIDVIKISFDHLCNLPQVLLEIFQDLMICVTQNNIKNVLLTSVIYVHSSAISKYDFSQFQIINEYGLDVSFKNLFELLARFKKDATIVSILNGNITDEMQALEDFFDMNLDHKTPEYITIFHLLMKLFILQQFMFQENFSWNKCVENIKTEKKNYFDSMDAYGELFDTIDDFDQICYILIVFEKYFPSRWLVNLSIMKPKGCYFLFHYYREFWSPDMDKKWLKSSAFDMEQFYNFSAKIKSDEALFLMIDRHLEYKIPLEEYVDPDKVQYFIDIINYDLFAFFEKLNISLDAYQLFGIEHCVIHFRDLNDHLDFDCYSFYFFLQEYNFLVDLMLFNKFHSPDTIDWKSIFSLQYQIFEYPFKIFFETPRTSHLALRFCFNFSNGIAIYDKIAIFIKLYSFHHNYDFKSRTLR
jgi:hypothetical protein